MRHFIDLLDWDGDQILKLLKEAARLKKAQLKGKFKPRLEGKVLGMVFEKPSLRTRVSFQAGMAQLGGQAIFLNVARSLAIACGKVGARFILSAPKKYRFDQPFIELYQTHVHGQYEEIDEPKKAVAEADVIYTDVWASMGQEAETKERAKHFAA